MAIETEFKFLVPSLPKTNFGNVKVYHINQIYFDGSKRKDLLTKVYPDLDINVLSTFRVRKIIHNNKENYILTLKSKALPNGMSRYEYEKEIDKETFYLLIIDNIDSEIIKNRYVDEYDGYKFEFDEYLNLAKPLVTVEVEVDNVEDYNQDVLKYAGLIKGRYNLDARDVTHNHIYKNSNLQKYFGKW